MQDGLSYFSGVGRGKGTIIQPPNLLPLFQGAAKQAQAAKLAKDKEVENQKEWLNKALDLGDKGWVEDATYLDGLRNQFTSDYVAAMNAYDGQKMPAEVTQYLTNRANKYRFIAQNSQKQRDEYYRFVDKLNKVNLDPQTRQKASDVLQEWVDTPTEKRTSLENFYLEKTYDYNKAIQKVGKMVNDQALQVARSTGIIRTPEGKFNRTETYKYTSLPLSQQFLANEYRSDPMFQRETKSAYEDWKTQNPSGTIDYVRYDVKTDANGNPTDQFFAVTETANVKDEQDYIKYVMAPSLVSAQERENVQMSTNISVSGGTPQSAQQAAQQTAEMSVFGTDSNQYGFAATSYSSITGYNLSPSQPGAKSRKGNAFKGSYALDPNKSIDFSSPGDMTVVDHYKVKVANSDIEITQEQAAAASLIDPSAIKQSGGKYYIKSGAPIPSQYSQDHMFSGKTRDADYITYEVVYKYNNITGAPTDKKQLAVDASTPEVRQWLDANMQEVGGKKFTEWYFGWPKGTTKTSSGTKSQGGGTKTNYGGNVR